MLSVEEHAISCIGCGNCENKCPLGAIKLNQDAEGFFYPVVNKEICILCGKCRTFCPMYQNFGKVNQPLRSYIAISKDKKILSRAASGGMFGTFAKVFLDSYLKSSVVGATYDYINKIVAHKIIEGLNDISSLQNSRYVQSQLNNVFVSVEKKLRSGEYVLFSGTPCQVDALNLFLKKEYPNLYTIDIICHGVPSYAFLEWDLKNYIDVNKIKDVRFRVKNKTRPTRSFFILSVVTEKGEKHVLSNRDPYFSRFMLGDSYRESCYQCKFASTNRIGDITIGDCDSHRLYPKFHPKMSVSTVLVNTPKGELLLSMCESLIEKDSLDLDKEAEVNTQLSHPTIRTTTRDVIYKEIATDTFKEFAKKYSRKRDIREKILLFKCLYM